MFFGEIEENCDCPYAATNVAALRVYFSSMLAVERSGLTKQTGPVFCGAFFVLRAGAARGRHSQLRLMLRILPRHCFGFDRLHCIGFAFVTLERRAKAIMP